MARVAVAWEKINTAVSDAQEYNLDRKPLVFAVFGWLAEAARGWLPIRLYLFDASTKRDDPRAQWPKSPR